MIEKDRLPFRDVHVITRTVTPEVEHLAAPQLEVHGSSQVHKYATQPKPHTACIEKLLLLHPLTVLQLHVLDFHLHDIGYTRYRTTYVVHSPLTNRITEVQTHGGAHGHGCNQHLRLVH